MVNQSLWIICPDPVYSSLWRKNVGELTVCIGFASYSFQHNLFFFFSRCNHHTRLQPEIVNLNLFIIWVGFKPIHSSYLQKPACIDHTEEGRCDKTCNINTPFQLHPCLPSSAHRSIPHRFRMLWRPQHIKRLQMTVEVTSIGAKGFHLLRKRKRRSTFASSVTSLCKDPGGDQQPRRSKSRTFT